MSFSRFNNAKKWSKDTTGFDYMKLREYLDVNGWDSEVRVFGYYINHLDNGDAVTIITDSCFINLPSHAVKVFSDMNENDDASIINGGLVLRGFKEIDTKFKNKTIVFDYADFEEIPFTK